MSWDSVPTTLLFGIRLPYQLRWEYVFNNKEWFIDGLKTALWMAIVSLFIGSIIGLLCAFVRSSGNRLSAGSSLVMSSSFGISRCF